MAINIRPNRVQTVGAVLTLTLAAYGRYRRHRSHKAAESDD
jgi:hypothetical protein